MKVFKMTKYLLFGKATSKVIIKRIIVALTVNDPLCKTEIFKACNISYTKSPYNCINESLDLLDMMGLINKTHSNYGVLHYSLDKDYEKLLKYKNYNFFFI